MRRPGFAPAMDPEGFDREQLRARLETEVLAFVSEHVGARLAPERREF